MLFVFHHLLFDGWSWKVSFEALTRGQAPIPQHCLNAYLNEQDLKATKVSHFWAECLQGFSHLSIQLSDADYVKDSDLDSAYQLSGGITSHLKLIPCSAFQLLNLQRGKEAKSNKLNCVAKHMNIISLV